MVTNQIKAARPHKNGKHKQPAVVPERAKAGDVAPEYGIADGCMIWITRDKKDRPCDVPLGNFAARILSAVVVDDGIEQTSFFDIEVVVGKRTFQVRGLPAEEFASLDWVIPRTLDLNQA